MSRKNTYRARKVIGSFEKRAPVSLEVHPLAVLQKGRDTTFCACSARADRKAQGRPFLLSLHKIRIPWILNSTQLIEKLSYIVCTFRFLIAVEVCSVAEKLKIRMLLFCYLN